MNPAALIRVTERRARDYMAAWESLELGKTTIIQDQHLATLGTLTLLDLDELRDQLAAIWEANTYRPAWLDDRVALQNALREHGGDRHA